MYTDDEENRALARLQRDLDALDRPRCHDTRAGLAVALALVTALAALGLILAL